MSRIFHLFVLSIIFLGPAAAQSLSDSGVNSRDSPALRSPSGKDTGQFAADSLQDSAASLLIDTAAIALQTTEYPPTIELIKTLLGENPYFNFFGKRHNPLMLERRTVSKDYLFYMMLGLLFYFGLLRISFEKYLNTLFLLFFRTSMRQQQLREQLVQTPLPSLLLNILFFVSVGLYASFVMNFYHVGHIKFFVMFACSSGGIFVLYLVKFTLLKVSGWLFNISRATEIYIFIVFLVNKMMGILLLPFLVILAFSTDPIVNEVAITVSTIMIGLLFVYRFSTAYKNIRSEIKLSLFHFFIYLCTFEITPLLLIYRVLLAYLEKAS